jgi:(p)ppGpp synthase/HD superfamily hydrolase
MPVIEEPSIEATISFIKEAHAGQVDKIGVEYWKHPMAVMNNLPATVSDTVKKAALLHDVIEDTAYTRADLSKRGYSDETLDIVELVTKEEAAPGEEKPSYLSKIQHIIDSGNDGAVLVKYADMKENTNPHRLAQVDAPTREKLKAKYAIPMDMLTKAVEKLGYAPNQPVAGR